MDVIGVPQPYELIPDHLKKDLQDAPMDQTRIKALSNMCFFAQRAEEFNQQKARQEKPDLISSNCLKTPVVESPPEAIKAIPIVEEERVDNVTEAVEEEIKVDVKKEVVKKKILQRTKRSQGSFAGVGKPPNVLVYSESLATRENAISALACVLRRDQ